MHDEKIQIDLRRRGHTPRQVGATVSAKEPAVQSTVDEPEYPDAEQVSVQLAPSATSLLAQSVV